MNIYIDTEFTDFIDPQLISIGMVDEQGREFYAELTDFDRTAASDFTKTVVFPLLGQHEPRIEKSMLWTAVDLLDWLQPYRQKCVICYDYITDLRLLNYLLWHLPDQERPDWLEAANIDYEINELMLDRYWEETKLPRHHALYDARGNKFAHVRK